MPSRPAFLFAFAAAACTLCTGCEWVLLGLAVTDESSCDADCCDCAPTPQPTPDPVDPPTVDLLIADWPPIGPEGVVTVEASSDDGLSSATFTFRNTVDVPMSGASEDSAEASGAELGEGLGSLSVRVTTFQGATTRRQVDGLLVDLGKPTIYVDDTTLKADGGELAYWMADAWIVAGSELLIDGVSVTHTELDPGYPSTLGSEWDFSLVTVPSSVLPLGQHDAEIRVWDAAGNEDTIAIPLVVDGEPPVATILSPDEGAIVSGPFQIEASAIDDLAATTEVEFWAGGALVATGVGPAASVTLDAAELPLGPLEIGVAAVDRAGNRSATVTRALIVAP